MSKYHVDYAKAQLFQDYIRLRKLLPHNEQRGLTLNAQIMQRKLNKLENLHPDFPKAYKNYQEMMRG